MRRWRWTEAFEFGKGTWAQGEFGGRFPTGLDMSDQSQDQAEACGSQEASILGVGNLPYLR